MIKEFIAREPNPDQQSPSCKDHNTCAANAGCLMVRAEIAVAN